MLKVGLIQQSCSNDIPANKLKTKLQIEKLASEGAELIVLQELHSSLYFCQSEDVHQFDLAHPIPGKETDYWAAIARENDIVLVTSLFEKRAAGIYHNTAVVFEKDGNIAGKYRKMHIPDDPGFYEKFYFTPGDLGFEPISTSVGQLGVLVCWDQWFPEAARLMALAGADILIYPTAIGWDPEDEKEEQTRQYDAWQTVMRGHAIANGIPLVAVNRTSFEPSPIGASGIQFWGGSFVCGPQGEMLYVASHDKEVAEVVDVDLERVEEVRKIWPFFRDRRVDAYQGILKRFLDE